MELPMESTYQWV